MEIPGDELPSLHKLPTDRWPVPLAWLPHITAPSNPSSPASLHVLTPRFKGTQPSALPLFGGPGPTSTWPNDARSAISISVDAPSNLPPRTSSNRILGLSLHGHRHLRLR